MEDKLPHIFGREDEVELILSALGDALKGNAKVILISGEAGVGKSRLVVEILEKAELLNFQIVKGECLKESSGEQCPFIKMFEHTLQEIEGDAKQIRRSLDPESLKFLLLNELHQIVRSRPALVCIEDLQYADTFTLETLNLFARNTRLETLVLLGTYRSEAISKVDGADNILERAIQRAKCEASLLELFLQHLNFLAIQKILADILGGPIEEKLAFDIFMAGGGNPLFCGELIKNLNGKSMLRFFGGVWRSKPNVELEPPSSIRGIILERMKSIPFSSKRILEIISVVGSESEPGIISHLLDTSPEDIAPMIRDLQFTHDMIICQNEVIKPRHEIISSCIISDMDPEKKSILHKKIGDYLLKTDRCHDFGVLSYHYSRSNDVRNCRIFSEKAAKKSLELGCPLEAIDLYTVALRRRDDEQDEEIEFRCLEGLGDAYSNQSCNREALSYYQRAIKLTMTNTEKARLNWKMGICWLSLGFSEECYNKTGELINEGLNLPDVDEVEMGELISCKASLSFRMGDYPSALRDSRAASQIFLNLDDGYRWLFEVHNLSYYLLKSGHPGQAYDSINTIDPEKIDTSRPSLRCMILCTLGEIKITLGLYEEAIDSLIKAIDLGKTLGLWNFVWGAYYHLSFVYIIINNYEEAQIAVTKSIEYATMLDSSTCEVTSKLLLAHIFHRMDQVSDAVSVYENASELMDTADHCITNQALLYGLISEMMISKGKYHEGLNYLTKIESLIGHDPYFHFLNAVILIWIGDVLRENGNQKESIGVYKKSQQYFDSIRNQ